MKVRLEIDDSLKEDEIVIRTKEYTEELKQLISNFKSKPSIQFFKQDTEYYLDLDAILFFESDNGTVYAHTVSDMFSTTQKLYELENILPNFFLRISKSTIVNIQRIYSLSHSVSSHLITFQNSHKQVYVSRMYYKVLKERSFYSPLFGIAIIFYLFREDLGFEEISLWLLLLATWLLAWGLTSIFHPEKSHIKVNKQIEINFGDDDTEDVEYSTNSIINITSSFGEKVQYIQTNDLQYVTIDSKFSGLKLYFDQATIQNQATIEIDGNFTGIELYVPKEWSVQSRVRAFFGGVDEKGQPSSSGYPTLNITGRVHFGGVEIHYI